MILQLLHVLSFAVVSCALEAYSDGRLFSSSFGYPGVNASYDYVIVGGGTAGLTLATRLAMNGSYSVAVVEAGSFYELDNGNYSQRPSGVIRSGDAGPDLSTVNGLIDWRFLTTPQVGLLNRTAHYARGKCLGGSSGRNYLLYQRGTVGCLSKWAKEVGDTSYEWQNVLPYYQKSTHYTPANTTTRAANSSRGTVDETAAFGRNDGPLQISLPKYAASWSSYFPSAFSELGLPALTKGTNDGVLNGWTYMTMSEDPIQQTRSSSETSFLRLALERTSLIVYTHALVKRIIFDDSKTARGVSVDIGGMTFMLNATKEVILSAGAFQSPQLLMVSGIGPASTLQHFDIPIISNLSGVGQNMWDNPRLTLSLQANLETGTTLINQPIRNLEETEKYIANRTGMLTSTGADFAGFVKLSDDSCTDLSSETRSSLAEEFPKDWPEAEFFASSNGAAGLAHDGAGIFMGLLATFSRGSVTIKSPDMAVAPVIDPAWLTDKRDQDLAVNAFKYARRLANTTSLRRVIVGEEVAPGPEVQSDEQILGYLRNTTVTYYHAACTCKMGMRNDSTAVVDKDGKVFGVKGLRVVDVSALPLLPPGQPQGTVYMLAEKIADRILDEA
ncbi:GMC oxidoreductase [Aureobasidium sp. EXF-10728]|nr:GMC oxidoreductase [Aureobasidium sp. EXF-10728]